MNGYDTDYICPEVPDNFMLPGINEMWTLWTNIDWEDGSISDYGYERHSIDQMIEAVLFLEHTQEEEDKFLDELPF